MEADGAGFDFSEFAAKFRKNFNQNDINLKELCITKSVMKPADFFKSMHQRMQEEAALTTPPAKNLGTVEEYAELFKVLETRPTNLQRVAKKKELPRTNSSTLKINETTQDQTVINTSGASSTLNYTRLEDERTVADVYSDFKKFQQKLQLVYKEADAVNKVQSDYMNMITQLQSFAHQLEKLMPCEREAPDAFTASEEANLVGIAENLKQLNYMCTHNLSNAANPNESAMARLEILVDILTYTLVQITCYINA